MSEGVRDAAERNRFELEVEGQMVYADYRRQGGRLFIDYVYAPPALRGSGASGRLMDGVIAAADAEGAEIVPICGYAATYIRRKSRGAGRG
jgi:hypothetical protein